MQAETYQDLSLKLAPLLHALGHPARVQIILHLSKYKGCQAGNISDKLPLAKSTVSEHLSKLKEAGLIKSLADRNCIYYALNDKSFNLIREYFDAFLAEVCESQESKIDCGPIGSI